MFLRIFEAIERVNPPSLWQCLSAFSALGSMQRVAKNREWAMLRPLLLDTVTRVADLLVNRQDVSDAFISWREVVALSPPAGWRVWTSGKSKRACGVVQQALPPARLRYCAHGRYTQGDRCRFRH